MKSLRNLFLLAALVLGGQHLAVGQVFDWAKLARTRTAYYHSIGVASTTDRNGNTYQAMCFDDSLQVGNQLLLGTNGLSALVKYNALGQVQWVQQLTNIDITHAGLAIDPSSGSVFLSAQLTDPALPARWAGTVVNTAQNPAFYAKCSAAGALQWVNPLPIATQVIQDRWVRIGVGIAADGQGSCYLTGRVHQPATLAGVALDTLSGFLLKTTATGQQAWLRRINTRLSSSPANPRYFPVDGLLLAGKPGGSGCVVWGRGGTAVYYGTTPTPNAGTPILTSQSVINFICNVDGLGNLQWVQAGPQHSPQFPSAGTVAAVTTDLNGNCYGTGSFGNGGFGVVKYNASGVQQWLRATNTYGYGGSTGITIAVDSLERLAVGLRPVLSISPPPTPVEPPCLVGNLRMNVAYAVMYLNAQGVPQWAVNDYYPPNFVRQIDSLTILGGGNDTGMPLGMDRQGNIYYSATTIRGIYASQSVVRLGAHTLVGQGTVLTRIGTRHNLVTGQTYLDVNGNGVRDASEQAFPRPTVLEATQSASPTLVTPNDDGQFICYVDSGTYQLRLPQVPLHYVISQPAALAYSNRLPGYGGTDSLRHFGISPVPNQADLRATLTPYGVARPGFPTRYRLTLENVGTTTVPTGTATVTLDAQMTFVGSYPAVTLMGRVVRWNYPAIPPFGSRTLDITASLAAGVPIGTVLYHAGNAPLAGDVVPADNSSTLTQIVRASNDPNDLTVSYEQLTPAQVASQLPLDYTIRFQNMGNDTAFVVVIKDTLNFRQLDLSSLQLVADSHPCTWSLTGTGELTVRFLGINLPYQAQNALGSQGFVRFRVLPKTTLALGDLVRNKADIVFDYNAPVRTNTATTAVLLPAALAADARATAFAAYPNPARETVSIAAELPSAGTVRLTLLDALGRSVVQQQISAAAGPLQHTLALGRLRPGLYVLRLQLPDGRSTSQRVVVE